MNWCCVFGRRCGAFAKQQPYFLSAARDMGGGPRTFPGGINKWQWKRLHEKKAMQKERRLIDQEKQIYQARLRAQIREKFSRASATLDQDSPNHHDPISSRGHLKALADRFMKEGAEDLWNQDDGPLTSSPTPPSFNTPPEKRYHFMKSSTNFGRRFYSVLPRRAGWRNGNSSSDDNDDTFEFLSSHGPPGPGPAAGNEPMFRLRGVQSSVIEEDEADGREGVRSLRKSSGDFLSKYGVIKRKRISLNLVERECDPADDIELIKQQLSKRKMEDDYPERVFYNSILSETRFDETGISPLTIKALTEAKYLYMSKVQEASLSVCLEGRDAMIKAKTGTGKSISFLLPTVEAVLKASVKKTIREGVLPIYALIVCPTRELASQVAAEANVLLKYHKDIGVQTLVGGVRFKEDQKRLEEDPCQIIVATPGRLMDHIENKSGFSLRLTGLKLFVLDEADHLLDLGFRKDIVTIADSLPRQRQSLLLSATFPNEVYQISQLVLKKEHDIIDTVGLGLPETHEKVKQAFIVAPHDHHFYIVGHLLEEHISSTPTNYKVIVFCITAMQTSLMFEVFRGLGMNVMEIHSRKPQVIRTQVSNRFRESNQMVLFTSDVSSRGMNYPDVTLVLQVGIPSDREQYIHRVGRTGRAGKEGEAIMLLAPWEDYFIQQVKHLPVERRLPPCLDSTRKLKVDESMGEVEKELKEEAYHSWLGYYNSVREISRVKSRLVELANRFSHSIGLPTPPTLFWNTAVKMGLRGVPGIRTHK